MDKDTIRKEETERKTTKTTKEMRTDRLEARTIADVERVINALCDVVAVVYENASPCLIATDRKISLQQFINEHTDSDHYIYGDFYFAIRLLGVESGSKKHCADRCKSLGAPVYVVKVEGNGSKLCTIKVRQK